MSGKRKPPVVTSPFEDSRMDTPQTQDDNSKLLFSNEPETEDVSPLNDLHADLGRGLQARRSLSSPDLASLAAEPEQSVEHAPPSIFQAGKHQKALLQFTRFPGSVELQDNTPVNLKVQVSMVTNAAREEWHGTWTGVV